MLSALCIVFVLFVQNDTSAEDEGEGWCPVKPVKTHQ